MNVTSSTPNIGAMIQEKLQIDETTSQNDNPAISPNTQQNLSGGFVAEFPENFDSYFVSTHNFKQKMRYCENLTNCSASNDRKKKSLSFDNLLNMENISQNPGDSFQETNLTLGSSDYEVSKEVKCDENLINLSSSATETSIKTSFCFVCCHTNECGRRFCCICGHKLQETSGKDNYQTNIDRSFIMPSIVSTEIPINPFESNKNDETNNCVISGDDFMHHYESTVRRNILLHSSLSSETPINPLEINKHQNINNFVTNDQYIECIGSAPRPTRNYDYSTLEYSRCNGNIKNGTTSNVSRGKSVSKDVEPVKEQRRNKTISKSESQEYFTSKTVGRNVKLDEIPCEIRDGSTLMVPSSSSSDILINSRLCLVCLIIVSEDDICRSCTNKMKQIYGENNSQTKIESNISLNTSLSRETPINSLDEEYFTSKTVGRNVKLDEGHSETRVGSLINSRLCLVCLIIVSEDDICRSCTIKMKKIYENSSSQIIQSLKARCSQTSINKLKYSLPVKMSDIEHNLQTGQGDLKRSHVLQKFSSWFSFCRTFFINHVRAGKYCSLMFKVPRLMITACCIYPTINLLRVLYDLLGNMNVTSSTPNIGAMIQEKLQIDETTSQNDNPAISPNTQQNLSGGFVAEFPENFDSYFVSTRNFKQKMRSCENLTNCSASNDRKKKSLSVDDLLNMENISQNPGDSFQETNSTLESSDYEVSKEVKCDEHLIDLSSSPTETSIKTLFCFVCCHPNEYGRHLCFNCGDKLQETSGKDNYQTDIDRSFIMPSIVSTEIPINPFETNKNDETNNCVISGDDDFMHHYESTVRQNNLETKCKICDCSLDILKGFFLRLCKHTVCEACVKNQVTLEKLADINITVCCDRSIELNEIKYFLTAREYEQFKTSLIELNETNSYINRCFGKNCTGLQLNEVHYEVKPTNYMCNKCELENCLECKAIHVWLKCEQYSKLFDKKNSLDDETKEMFLTWIREGIAMPCPNCVELIEKDEGCDWVQCPFCNTEICWATRGPRWGPNGKGDKSGGCGCDFKIKKCVVSCNYCH